MAFSGHVNIVKRKNKLHCGTKARLAGSTKIISVCNGTWSLDDIVYEAMAEDVTCKRCLKILAKADESGKIKL